MRAPNTHSPEEVRRAIQRISSDVDSVSGLTTAVSTLQSNVGGLNGRVEALESSVVILEGSLEDAHGDIITLDGRIDALEGAIGGGGGVSGLTAGRVPFADSATHLTDDSDLTFDGTKLSATSLAVAQTTSSTVGVIFKGADRFIHNYANAASDGHNTFIGVGAGNFTCSGATYRGSYNVGVGDDSVRSITTGFSNLGLGYNSLGVLTSGKQNVGVGARALEDCVLGSYNTAIGDSALSNNTNSTGFNTGIGVSAGINNISGSNCVFIGANAGLYETGTYKLFIDSVPRSNEANGRTQSLIYGVFNETVLSQTLRFNGKVGINSAPIGVSAWLTLPAGASTGGAVPMEFTSGALQVATRVGAVEFLTDKLYFTITTGGARKEIALSEGLTSGRIPYATTNGRLTDSTNIRYDGTNVILSGLKYPNVDGSANYVIKTDGSGNLGWVAQSNGISGLTAGRVPYASSATALTDSAAMSFDGTQLVLSNGINLGFSQSTPNQLAKLNEWWIPRYPDFTHFWFLDYMDEYAYYHKKPGVTFSTSPAPDYAPAAGQNVVFFDDAQFIGWSTGTSPGNIVLEVDALAGYDSWIRPKNHGLYALGLTFRNGLTAGPTHIKIEAWDYTPGAYATVFDQDVSISGYVPWVSPTFAAPSTSFNCIIKLRVTFTVPNPLPSNFFLQRLMLYHATSTYDPWHVHVGGGIMYGNLTLDSGVNVVCSATTGTKVGTATSQKLGFWNATPVAQQALSAYTTDDESAAYSGIDNAQGGSVYAQLSDLNALRTAYDNLRTAYDDLRAKLKTIGILG